MDLSNPFQRKIFMEIHSGLPRESCGSDASTFRALSNVRDYLPETPFVGDFACGPGSSAIPLAKFLPTARLLALDRHPPYIVETQARAKDAGVSDRLDAVVGDMLSPPIEPRSLDMIWCEGGIYNVGVAEGLREWKKYLKPEGIVVFNEPIWLTEDATRPEPISDFWAAYVAMTDDPNIRDVIKSEGYDLLGSFDLPDSDWWEPYYIPLEAKLDGMEEKYRDIPAALLPIAATRKEIAMRHKFPEHYNYRFYCIKLGAL